MFTTFPINYAPPVITESEELILCVSPSLLIGCVLELDGDISDQNPRCTHKTNIPLFKLIIFGSDPYGSL